MTDVPVRKSAVREQAEVDERFCGAQLVGNEACEQDDTGGDGGEHVTCHPGACRTLGDAVHEEAEPKAGEQEAGQVEAPRVLFGHGFKEHSAEDECRHPDGKIDVEDPAPGEVGDEQAAENRTEGWRKRRWDRENARSSHSVGRRKDPVEHGHSNGGKHSAADALEDTEQHELGHVGGKPAQRRGEREDHDGCE